MASKTFRFTGIIGGLYAASNIFDQPQGTIPRISNLVFTERGGLLTVDGTHVVSRPAPALPPRGFISSGAVTSSQPAAPTVRSTSAVAGIATSPTNSPHLSVDVPTPAGATIGDVIIAIVHIQNKNFFSTTPALTPPSPDWVLGFYNGGFDTQSAGAVYSLNVKSPLPATLTFVAQGDSTVNQAQMTVTLVALEGANTADPLDNIQYSSLTQVAGALLINGTNTNFVNDLILISASTHLDFFSWGGVVTPGTPAGTAEINLLQNMTIGCTQVVYDQSFVGPGPTGSYTIPTGWAGASSSCFVIAIGAGSPDDGDVEGFEPTDDGIITPDPVITGGATQLSAPQGMFFDAQKQLWVADAQSGNLGAVFMWKKPAQDGGNRPSDVQISGSFIRVPFDVVVDGAGSIYVANNGFGSQDGFISVFPIGSTGNATPSNVISGANTTLVSPVGVAVDGQGYIYVIDSTQNAIVVFPPNDPGNIHPVRVITGINTLIFNPQAIRFDSAGNLWLAVGKTVNNPAYLLTFAPGVSGNASPANLIGSSAFQPIAGDGGPSGFCFDPSGNIFVAVYKNQTVVKITSGSSGGVEPAATLTGWINGPWGIAIPPN